MNLPAHAQRGRVAAVLLITTIATTVLVPPSANAASITALGDLVGGIFSSTARAVSDDGSVVVGSSVGANGIEAFRWTSATGMQGLGDLPGGVFYSEAHGVSADGSVIVGSSNSTDANREQAFRWTEGTGMTGLGDLTGTLIRSAAYDVSADGSVIVGRGQSAAGVAGFIHESGTMTELPRAPSGGIFVVSAVSADGRSAAGESGVSGGGNQALLWTQSGGSALLGDFAGGANESRAYGISADGSTVVGYGSTATGREPFLWTESTGLVGLGNLTGGGAENGVAFDVSGDGSIVVGHSFSAFGFEGFIWDTGGGMRALLSELNALGADTSYWNRLGAAFGISDNGRFIVGAGTSRAGQTEAYLIDLGAPAGRVPDGGSTALLLALVIAACWAGARKSMRFAN